MTTEHITSASRSRHRVVSGMRPTGKLHLGNLVGALEKWVEMQDLYENFHLVADWHVLTTAPQNAPQIRTWTIEIVTDWLSCGLDPERAIFFRQSRIHQHSELHLIFSMLVTLNRLVRNPTVKEQARDLGLEETISYGHIGYPVLQAADILLYKGSLVPVGEDQLPHLELTREIARRFNTLYAPIFPEPEPLLTPFARLPGLDGKRMSKSLGNVIFISDPPDEVRSKLRTAFTDPLKIRKGDPGRPELCLVFTYHQKFNPQEAPQIAQDCRSGALGCVNCKKRCAQAIIDYLEPVYQRRSHITARQVIEVLESGEIQARSIASMTIQEVLTAMGMT